MSKINLINPESQDFKQFFEDCFIVMSAPNVFFYVGEHVVLKGTPALVQAMPTRVYVGLCNGCEKDLIIRVGFPNYKEFTIPEGERKIGVEQVRFYIKSIFNAESNMLNRFNCIKVWSDIEPGSGANWSGAYSSALAAAVFIGIIQQLNQLNISNFINDFLPDYFRRYGKDNPNTDIFRKINKFAFFLESLFHGGSSSGYGTFISLIGHKYPVIFKPPTRWKKTSPYINIWNYLQSTKEPNNKKELTELVGKYEEEILNPTRIYKLPNEINIKTFTTYVVDTGRRKFNTAKAITHVYNTIEDDLEKLYKLIKSYSILNSIKFSPDEVNRIKNVIENIETFTVNIDSFVLLTIIELNKYLSNPSTYSNTKILGKKFIAYMNSVGESLEALGLGWKELYEIKNSIFGNINNGRKETAVKLSGGGTAGVVTVVTFNNEIQKLFSNYRILYDSAVDINSIKGLQLQKLEEK